MKKYIILIITITYFLSCQNKSNKIAVKPQQSNITESVYGSVKISPKSSYHAQPVRPGILDKIYIKEGELVTKGQILFQIQFRQ